MLKEYLKQLQMELQEELLGEIQMKLLDKS